MNEVRRAHGQDAHSYVQKYGGYAFESRDKVQRQPSAQAALASAAPPLGNEGVYSGRPSEDDGRAVRARADRARAGARKGKHRPLVTACRCHTSSDSSSSGCRGGGGSSSSSSSSPVLGGAPASINVSVCFAPLGFRGVTPNAPATPTRAAAGRRGRCYPGRPRSCGEGAPDHERYGQ